MIREQRGQLELHPRRRDVGASLDTYWRGSLPIYRAWYTGPTVWTVRYVDEAERERAVLPANERVAIDRAVDKLAAFGPDLPFPHQSSVRGAAPLRELRPRAGRSAWRAFYVRVGDVFIIAAVGPEAQANARGFSRTVKAAEDRVKEVTNNED